MIPQTDPSRWNILKKRLALSSLLAISFFSIAVVPASAATSFSWETLPNMPTARGGATGVALGDKVYLFGGTNSFGFVAPVSEYSVTTGTWQLKAQMPTLRYDAASAVGPDGKVYVVGGRSTNSNNRELASLEIYDPLTDTWATGSAMPTARIALSAVFGSNGRLYAIGGLTDDLTGTHTNIVEEYNPTTNTWLTKQPLNYSRYAHGAVKGLDGSIYVGGGSPQYGIEIYNELLNTWTLKTPPFSSHIYGNLIAAPNGRIYLLGYSQGVDEYNPNTHIWSFTTGSMPVAGYRYPIVLGSDNLIYRFGGEDSFSSGNVSQKVMRGTILSPNLAIAMTDSPDPVGVRKALTYSITVTNSGSVSATNVIVTDTLPANSTFVSTNSSQGNCTGTSTITCNLGNISNGASAIINIVVKPTTTGIRNNTASVVADEPEHITSNNSVTVSTSVVK